MAVSGSIGISNKITAQISTYVHASTSYSTTTSQRIRSYDPITSITANITSKIRNYELLGSSNAIGDATNANVLRCISLGGASSKYLSSVNNHLQLGIGKNNTEGSATPPALELKYPGSWQFRWALKTGLRTISIKCKQVCNLTPRPTLTIKANPNIGVNSDVIISAASSTTWTDIGPVSFVATNDGAIIIELSNNISTISNTPAYFDHIVTS